MRPSPRTGTPSENVQGIEEEINGMKKDAESLGKQMSNRPEREQAEVLDNLREQMKDLGEVHNLKEIIQEPFCRGTRY